ncbi:MAG: type II toxin-antitoxin system prevent-host-death family antitoxin [Dorea sp.]|nr:type II toxin-antitoxin system prevent-host-death family antitoxin [Dorea sp.]
MPVIKPITELRDTNAISEICHKQQQPVFITKNGYGDLVVMSIEVYDELINMNRIDKSILEAEQEVSNGAELLDAREALSQLRRKHFG